ncbi:MAG: response regulator, partial [Okeania sp. SIO3B3]|nr:response regulator [Okeania sp. SIO3B3]
MVSVADTGIGIPDDQLDSIFEEFTQVDASTTRKVGGTGLGLPICRHFIEMHKGQIWVESTVGKGSTFSFAIPINNDANGADDGIDGDTEDADGGGKVIVAIDDDAGVVNLYKRFLEKRNYKIVGVKSTDAVTDRVKAFAPAVILLDILMPGRDGWAVIRDLKEDPYTADIPVIICSIVSDKNRGYSMGAADYLIKPIVEGELISALRNLNDANS